jgi:hypothetical protein
MGGSFDPAGSLLPAARFEVGSRRASREHHWRLVVVANMLVNVRCVLG